MEGAVWRPSLRLLSSCFIVLKTETAIRWWNSWSFSTAQRPTTFITVYMIYSELTLSAIAHPPCQSTFKFCDFWIRPCSANFVNPEYSSEQNDTGSPTRQNITPTQNISEVRKKLWYLNYVIYNLLTRNVVCKSECQLTLSDQTSFVAHL